MLTALNQLQSTHCINLIIFPLILTVNDFDNGLLTIKTLRNVNGNMDYDFLAEHKVKSVPVLNTI